MRKQYKFIQTIQSPFAGGKQSLFLTNNIPTDFFLWGLSLDLALDLTIGAGGATAIPVESPQNFLERVIVRGNRRGSGDEIIWNSEGSTLFRYAHLFGGTQPAIALGGLAVAAATYSMRVNYLLPFVRLGVTEADEYRTLLPAPDFNSLSLEIQVGNGFTLASGAATRVLAGFGATTNPTIDVHRIIPLLGSAATRLRPALVKRTFLDFDATVTGVDSVIGNLPSGNAISSILLKTGVRVPAAATAAAPGFDTLSDAILTRPRVKINGVPIRDFMWIPHQNFNKLAFGLEAFPPGYNVIDFVRDGRLEDALLTYTYGAQGTSFQLGGDVTGAANQRILAYVEEIVTR